MDKYYITCPLDRNHRILVQRLQKHFEKCIKSRSKTGPVICPFNSQHIIDASKISEHCIMCPNIKDVFMSTCKTKSGPSNNVSLTSTSTINFAAKIKKDNASSSSKNTESVGKKQLEIENRKSQATIINPFVICPFDKNHRVPMDTFLNHFHRCKMKHSITDNTINLLKVQHVNDNSQISQHNNSYPGTTGPLIPVNIDKNKDNFSRRNVSSMLNAHQSVACHSATRFEENNTTCSKDYSQIIVRSQLERPKPLRRPACETLKTSEVETSIKTPYVQGIEAPKTDENSSKVVLGITTNSESHHIMISDNSKDMNSCLCDQPKPSEKKAINFAELDQKLQIIKQKEIAIAKELKILRQKEKEIGEEKKEIIEMFKKMVLLTTDDENHH